MVYNAHKWKKFLVNYILGLVHEKFDVEMKSLHRQNSLACGPLYLNSWVNPKDMSDLIDSNVNLLINALNWRN